MLVCEFCLQYTTSGTCRLDLKIPKTMTCREFGPTLEKFCSNPSDFVDPKQIVQMAVYFGIKGPELKKIKLMAATAQSSRLEIPPPSSPDTSQHTQDRPANQLES
jgi:hypothetical protein